MKLQDYANLIFSQTEVALPKAELDPIFEQITDIMFNCPVRRRNRDYDTIRKSVNKMALEYGLDKLGIPLNSMEFDYTNPHSYAYDNILNTDTFECKNFHDSWYSFRPEHVATMLKNIQLIKYFVSGTVDITDDSYIIKYKLIANAASFKRYICESRFANAKLSHYYNHHTAVRDGHAFFRSN